MTPICKHDLSKRLAMAASSAAILFVAGCATAPAPAPAPAEPQRTAADLLSPLAVPTASLTAQDPGITALAAALSGAKLIGFMGTGTGSQEDALLKSALTEVLTERYHLGAVILDTPCAGANELDAYIGGAQTGELAADVVGAAHIAGVYKTAALADLLTMLRGWNAIYADAPVRVAGYGCETARMVPPGRPAIFWGFTESPADMGEKMRAAQARGEVPAEPFVWLVQVSGETAADIIPATGWIDMRALPDDPLVADWREAAGPGNAVLRADHPWSADIVFRHPDPTPAEAP
ncbi:MAG: hypothetical protein ACK4MQ_04220 [Hyphomonas sp.]